MQQWHSDGLIKHISSTNCSLKVIHKNQIFPIFSFKESKKVVDMTQINSTKIFACFSLHCSTCSASPSTASTKHSLFHFIQAKARWPLICTHVRKPSFNRRKSALFRAISSSKFRKDTRFFLLPVPPSREKKH